MPRASSRLKSTKRPRYTEVIPGRASKLIKTANEKLAAKPSVPTVVPVDSSDSEASYPFSRSPSPSEQALAPISMPPDDVEVENVFNKLNELNSDIFALRDDIKDIKTTMNDILKILKGKPAISGNRAVGRKISEWTSNFLDSNSWNLNEAFDSDFNKTVNENTTVYLQKMIEKTQGRSWSAFISEKGIETKLRHVYYKRKSKVENATKARIGFLQKKRRINRKTYKRNTRKSTASKNDGKLTKQFGPDYQVLVEEVAYMSDEESEPDTDAICVYHPSFRSERAKQFYREVDKLFTGRIRGTLPRIDRGERDVQLSQNNIKKLGKWHVKRKNR